MDYTPQGQQNLYDPVTGTWSVYKPASGGGGGAWGVLNPGTPASLTPIDLSGLQTEAQSGQIAPTGTAQGMAAKVLAAEFANWETQYKPVEQNLLMQTSFNNPEILTDAVNQATTNATGAADSMQGVEARQMASQGVVATPQQTAVNSRLNNLSRAQMVAGAQNTARQNVATQDELIAIGSAPNPNPAAQSAMTAYKQTGA